MSKDKKIPYVKIAFAGIIVAGGIATMYNLGVFKSKTKKSSCVKALMSPDWNPNKFASQLYGALKGLSIWGGEGTPYYKKMLKANEQDLKCLHNSWNRLIDDKESVYDFINSQIPYYGSSESLYQKKVLKRLNQIGLGIK